MPGLRLYGPTARAGLRSRLGVIAFNVDGVHHGLVAAVLGYEHGVGARTAASAPTPTSPTCSASTRRVAAWAQRAPPRRHARAPGMVRISFGCYNDEADVDRAVDALECIAAGDIAGRYRCDDDGEHHPIAYREPMPGLFTMMEGTGR